MSSNPCFLVVPFQPGVLTNDSTSLCNDYILPGPQRDWVTANRKNKIFNRWYTEKYTKFYSEVTYIAGLFSLYVSLSR